MRGYLAIFWDKCKESAVSILPFFGIITALYLIFLPFSIWGLLALLTATLFMIIGMSLFSVGIDMSAMKMGGYIGSNLSKSRRLSLMVILSFVLGFIVTIAEPDLMVLAEQVPGISSKWILLITVSAGTGIFLILSTIRTIFRWSMKTVLIVSYAIVIALSILGNARFVPLAVDSVGVTTGSISVPFIMSFGLGICAVRSGKNNQEDGFGLIALASVGPAIAVLIMSLFLRSNGTIPSETAEMAVSASTYGGAIISGMLNYLKEVFIVILPIFVFFLIYNFIFLKLPKITLFRLMIGLVYSYIGLVLFLTGVTSGYLPTSSILGYTMSEGKWWWTTMPLGLLLGYFLVAAEPAIAVLNQQVEDITEGVIKKKSMQVSLAIGVSIAVFMSVARCLFDINYLWFLIPLVVMSIILAYFCPNLFVSIAFDSGGTAAGTLSASFVLPFIVGIATQRGLDTMLYAFGTIGIIAIVPVIVIEIMGIRFEYVRNKRNVLPRRHKRVASTVTIYDFE